MFYLTKYSLDLIILYKKIDYKIIKYLKYIKLKIMSTFEYQIHPIANILNKLINLYETDTSWYINKRFKCYYVKTIFSFYDYVFDFIIADEYFMENGLIKSYTVLTPAELCGYRADDADPYYVNSPDETTEIC
jgi:hypothetical protein